MREFLSYFKVFCWLGGTRRYHQIQLKPQAGFFLNFSQEEGAADAILLQDPAGQNLFVVNQVQPELFVMGIPAGMGPL